MAEECRVSVRHARQKANEGVKAELKEHEMSEDQAHRILEKVQQLTDEYGQKIEDLLAILGSSQTFHHVAPAVIEAELARCGRRERVLNLGVPALRGPEQRYLAARLLERRPASLKLLVMQDAIPAEGVLANALSDRGRYFRGWSEIGEAAADVACYTGSTLGKVKRALIGGQAVVAEQVGTQRLSQALLPAPEAALGPYAAGKYRRFDGFWPITAEDYDPARQAGDTWFTSQRRAFAEERAGFTAAVRDGGAPPDPAGARCRAHYLHEKLETFQAAGYRTAYYVSPSPYWINHDRAIAGALRAEAAALPQLDYNDPKAHPELFQGALWFDRTHLLAEGAERLSQAIGRDLCSLLAK
jgi:hypothetical protein